jgi:tRNA dimethylallyltransferase
MVAKSIEIIAIVGPTASGKTALAMSVARAFNGEIIAVDSRTIYKGLNVGTAKPTAEQQSEIKHWAIDIVEPSEKYSAAQFKQYANKAITSIRANGKLPIMVGGTGLYMDGVLYDFSFTEPNHKLREELQTKSVDELKQQIRTLGLPMPHNNQNKLHLITAIERNGVATERKKLRKGVLLVGISPDRTELRRIVTVRAKQMLENGVLEEAKQASSAYGWDAPGLQGGIYTILKQYIDGDITEEECLKNYITSDMRLAKRQMTWLKRNTDIQWFTDIKTAEAWIQKTLRSTL